MGKASKMLISAFCVVALVGAIIIFALYRIHAGMLARVDRETGKDATGTVVSVTEERRFDLADSKDGNRAFDVCFTIDNFDRLADKWRRGYQAAEADRLKRDGP